MNGGALPDGLSNPTEPDITPILDQLIAGTGDLSDSPGMIAQLCELLVQRGIPLWRVGIFVRTLHPNIFGRNYIWRSVEGVTTSIAEFGIDESPEFLRSPMRPLYYEGVEVRHRMDEPEAAAFPFFDDMRAEGVTDYFAAPLRFIDGALHGSSWTTRQPGGFTAAQLAALRKLLPPLTRLIEAIGLRRRAQTLLDTYVGSRAGERILAGQIRRGHTETMHAAIWLSDLRGFTAMSDRLPSATVVDILNAYFDCQVPAILRHGGEVLKFMGDGLLAVFPLDQSHPEIVTAQALEAAREARTAVGALRHDEAGPLRFGVALHLGEVLYGNIGGGDRLDFTCIGPAVNLAARLEKIAGKLHRTVVASQSFAQLCGQDHWTDLGEFPIAGFAKAERVYGLADEEALTQ